MFDDNDVVHVAAPTETAAFNVGGETLHQMFSIMVEDDMKNLKGISEQSKKGMHVKFKKAIVILIDEHSMVGMRMLGSACSNVNECAHGGNHSDEDWGGVPTVILVGDDFQLPPPFDKGAFNVLHYGSCNMVFLALKLLVQSSSSLLKFSHGTKCSQTTTKRSAGIQGYPQQSACE
jgi:hypothetical protein